MSKKSNVRLQKEAEPITLEVDVRLLLIMSFIFFIALALIGSAFRHYPSIQACI